MTAGFHGDIGVTGLTKPPGESCCRRTADPLYLGSDIRGRREIMLLFANSFLKTILYDSTRTAQMFGVCRQAAAIFAGVLHCCEFFFTNLICGSATKFTFKFLFFGRVAEFTGTRCGRTAVLTCISHGGSPLNRLSPSGNQLAQAGNLQRKAKRCI